MIYVVAFDQIKIQTYLALQNDRQNQSFVKDNYVVYVVGKKMGQIKVIVSYCQEKGKNTSICLVSLKYSFI